MLIEFIASTLSSGVGSIEGTIAITIADVSEFKFLNRYVLRPLMPTDGILVPLSSV